MTIFEFIKKAVEGGWKLRGLDDFHFRNQHVSERTYIFASTHHIEIVDFVEILLDPLAWQAVGKVEGWETEGKISNYWEPYDEGWRYHMHAMIDALAEGRSIEDFLAEL